MSGENPFGRKPKEAILLDQFDVKDIRKWSRFRDELARMHWESFSDLSYQRSKIGDRIASALRDAANHDFEFIKWQRLVTYQYSSDPLSVTGSLIDPGGRFNIGDINQTHFPVFPALYVAEDKDTVLQEALCQPKTIEGSDKALESALTDSRSISIVSVSGRIESLIDLNHPERLRGFVEHMRGFGMNRNVVRIAMKYKIKLELIGSVELLMKALLEPNWRAWPMHFDVPFTSQIFGRLVKDAGIDGILFPSVLNQKNCLALFPQCFQNSDSFIQLDDKPPKGVRRVRLDSTNWSESDCAKVPRIDEKLIKKIVHTSKLAGMIRKVVAQSRRFWPFGNC